MLKRTKPNVPASMYKLRMMFPHRGEALISTLKIENGKQKLMPAWRQLQIAKLVGIVNLYAGDLGERYRARRIDALATVTRNLCELCVWTQYCNLSDEKAKTFFEDSARDFREIMQALQTLYTAVNGRPESDLTENIRNFQGIAEAHGIKDYDHRYVQVRDAAKDSGRGDAFSILYKIFSKLAHPTSLVLALDIKTGELSEMLDSLYVGGEQFASASLREIEKSILKIYPSLAC